MSDRQFPVIGPPGSLPWGLVEKHVLELQINHYPSITDLADSGGLSMKAIAWIFAGGTGLPNCTQEWAEEYLREAVNAYLVTKERKDPVE